MATAPTFTSTVPADPLRAGDVDQRIRAAIEHAAHLLPSQGPITVFIHHNTLHAFEDLPFHDAVKEAAAIYGCQPYMPEDRYREELARGRMAFADVQQAVDELLGGQASDRIAKLCTRAELQLAMLQFPLRHGPAEYLRWFVAETDALRCVRNDVSTATRRRLIAETRRWVMRDLRGQAAVSTESPSDPGVDAVASVVDLLQKFGASRIESWSPATWEAFTLQALWRLCCNGVSRIPPRIADSRIPIRHRDLLRKVLGVDSDDLVHELLVPFCGAYLDQGLARWQLPGRDDGFYTAFLSLYRLPAGAPEPWRRGLADELSRLADEHVTPIRSIHASLTALGVAEDQWDHYLTSSLIALRGWAGMIHFLEQRPDRVVRPIPPGSLIDYLAVRLILERHAVTWLASSKWHYNGSLSELRDQLLLEIGEAPPVSTEDRAFSVFQLAQVLGWSPIALHQLSDASWRQLVEEIESFTQVDRCRVLHSAYERRLQTQALDAIALHARQPQPEPATPMFQATFCIDEREESIRRHIEELAPNSVTYSIAGFYFVDMYYRGVSDAHFVPLCPPVVLPQHWVVEEAEGGGEGSQRWRVAARRALGLASHQFHVGSRTLGLSTLVSTVGGLLATVPLIARTLFPRLTAQIRKAVGKAILAQPTTRLRLEREEQEHAPDQPPLGYSVDEMTVIAERVLRDLGLISGFARLVLMFGHGSTSMNNPHESAYDCGACGGSRGAPSARAIAQILNHRGVRQRLVQRGITIPDETVFLGGMHNTSNSAVTYADLDLVPQSHRAHLERVRALIDAAAERDAHERCRRFYSAPLALSFEDAKEHVEGRAEDLSQVRPELGHATNALAVVGRRCRTRGLFLDRRAFLNSYDPTQDDHDGTILERILQAMVPVCAGINLEYYFSYMDNSGYGSGTKLPHNVTALLGVMDGAASDLRTGLPWQMVEIHEPVRMLLVVETTQEVLQRILDRNPGIARLVRNEWFSLALLDPHSAVIQLLRNGVFHEYQPTADRLPRAASSIDWYRGWRGHLEFARIGPTRKSNRSRHEESR